MERAKQPGVANGPWLWRLGQAGCPGRADGGGGDNNRAKVRTAEGTQVRTFDPSTEPAVGPRPRGGEGDAQRADADEGDSPAKVREESKVLRWAP